MDDFDLDEIDSFLGQLINEDDEYTQKIAEHIFKYTTFSIFYTKLFRLSRINNYEDEYYTQKHLKYTYRNVKSFISYLEKKDLVIFKLENKKKHLPQRIKLKNISMNKKVFLKLMRLKPRKEVTQ